MGKLSKKISTIALSSTMLFGTVTIQATSIFTTGRYTIPYFSEAIEIKYHTYDENTSREEFIFWINENQYNVICLDNHNNTKTIMVTVSDVNKRSAQSYKFDTYQQDAKNILMEILVQCTKNNTSIMSQTHDRLDKASLSSESSSVVGDSDDEKEDKKSEEEQQKAPQTPKSLKELESQKTTKISKTATQLLDHKHTEVTPWYAMCDKCGIETYYKRFVVDKKQILFRCTKCNHEKKYKTIRQLSEALENRKVSFYCSTCKSYKSKADLYEDGNETGYLCKTCRDRTMPGA